METSICDELAGLVLFVIVLPFLLLYIGACGGQLAVGMGWLKEMTPEELEAFCKSSESPKELEQITPVPQGRPKRAPIPEALSSSGLVYEMKMKEKKNEY